MVQALKMAARVATLVALGAALFYLFTIVQVPSIDLSGLLSPVSKGLAVFYHWIPGAALIWNFVKSLIAITIIVFSVRVVIIGLKWAFKISEG